MEEGTQEIDYGILYQGPIKDQSIWINCRAVFAFVFICVMEVAAIVVSILFAQGIQLKLLISLVLIPFIILAGIIPYKARFRIDLLNKYFSISRRGILFFLNGCCMKTFLLANIQSFTVDKNEILGERTFYFYVNLKSGEKEMILGGTDSSPNVGNKKEIDSILDFLNYWLKNY